MCSGGQGINYGTGLCEPCAVGSYQLPWMTQVCASCPAGYSTLQAGTVGDQTSCLCKYSWAFSYFSTRRSFCWIMDCGTVINISLFLCSGVRSGQGVARWHHMSGVSAQLL